MFSAQKEKEKMSSAQEEKEKDEIIYAFGCWSSIFNKEEEEEEEKDKCGVSKIYDHSDLKHVLNTLKETVKQEELARLVILGDNYYADKVKDKVKSKPKNKQKYIVPANIVLAYNKLFEASTDIHKIDIILGNHDIEDDGVAGLNACEPDIPCNILNTQINIINIKNKQEEPEDIKPEATTQLSKYEDNKNNRVQLRIPYRCETTANCLLLFIDTTLFKEKLLSECYKKYLQSNITTDITIDITTDNNYVEFNKALCDLQYIWLLEQIKGCSTKKIIIFGHEPLISFKCKTEDTTKKSKEVSSENKIIQCDCKEVTDYCKPDILNYGGRPLIQAISDVNTNHKEIYYICADVHNYVNASFTIGSTTIHQIICGTGGADKDKTCTTISLIEDSLISRITVHEKKYSNGFLKLTIKNNEIITDFIATGTLITKQKYIKYKTKYLNLKQLLYK